MLKRGQLLAGLVTFLVEIIAGRKEGRHVGARWPTRRRHSLLAPDQLVVHISTEFVKLCGRQAKKLVAGFVRSAAESVVAVRDVEEPPQRRVVLTQNLLYLAMSPATIAWIVA